VILSRVSFVLDRRAVRREQCLDVHDALLSPGAAPSRAQPGDRQDSEQPEAQRQPAVVSDPAERGDDREQRYVQREISGYALTPAMSAVESTARQQCHSDEIEP
jgi:hypothetical protein